MNTNSSEPSELRVYGTLQDTKLADLLTEDKGMP